MIVSISGVHGTGKTTLVNSLYENLKNTGYNVRINQELARELIDNFHYHDLFNNEQIYLKFEKILMEYYLFSVEYYRNFDGIILMDRCLMDVYPYIDYLYTLHGKTFDGFGISPYHYEFGRHITWGNIDLPILIERKNKNEMWDKLFLKWGDNFFGKELKIFTAFDKNNVELIEKLIIEKMGGKNV